MTKIVNFHAPIDAVQTLSAICRNHHIKISQLLRELMYLTAANLIAPTDWPPSVKNFVHMVRNTRHPIFVEVNGHVVFRKP